MKVELNTNICPIIVPDTYNTGFQTEIVDSMWDEFVRSMVTIGAGYIRGALKKTRDFKACSVDVDDRLVSPSQYNYMTDSIDFSIEISDDLVEKLRSQISDVKFLAYIKRSFGSHAGFVSNYPTTEEELKDAFNKPGSTKFALAIAEFILWECAEKFDLDQYNDQYLTDVYEDAISHDYIKDEEEEFMSDSKKSINSAVNRILEGADITKTLMSVKEGAGRLASVKIIDEPYGKGIEVKDSNGGVYRYAVDTSDPKYYTPEKVLHAVQAIARRNNYEMDKIYNFLKNNTLGHYDKDVSGRTGLKKAEIIVEPYGEGLKVTLDNGKSYLYTVNTSDAKYDTLEKLKDGAEGMWRHGASIDGILKFLDDHAMLYAREAKERMKQHRELMNYIKESKDRKVSVKFI